jgi:hypothetical protein
MARESLDASHADQYESARPKNYGNRALCLTGTSDMRGVRH